MRGLAFIMTATGLAVAFLGVVLLSVTLSATTMHPGKPPSILAN
jgi:hypothetical protein